MTTILGIDPGTTNFAYAVLTGPRAVKATGLVQPYKKAGDVEQMRTIVKTLTRVVRAFKPDLVVIERFMFRGGGSVAAECMNHAIGFTVLTMERLKIPWRMIPAAQWKNYGTKEWGYENDAKSKGRARALAKKIFPKLKNIDVIHIVDAACLARYGFEKGISKGWLGT